ncbi:hypothetical protein Q4Q39_02620 [Flavivirga amylovorans]|uniref:Prepilin type IV endopeptidase peptidase domain-containing protein n=1 Tax=Flavivirga amylovorans TaxID=870486 RepID=A0ABT8WXR0_9FLAO|nr:hypothetical protein [Flavivirga amylovorans]MDO5986287.1 hypothetical protein [Flavivirga amylovorans]
MHIITTLKLVLILIFTFIGFQDIKERQVYWFLFPVIGILCGILFYKNTLPELFFNAITLNVIFVTTLILIVFLYSNLKLKTRFLNTIGLGDVLLFAGLSLSFATISFIIIFVSALFFSLLLHIILKKRSAFRTVPLAGYMSLFFSITYMAYWSGFINGLYRI